MTAYKYFTDKELQCKCGCAQNKMDDDFMHIIEQIRAEAGFPFIVTSAYRCPEWNAQTSSTGGAGPHTTGKAIDIHCYHGRFHKIMEIALKYKMMGIGVAQKGSYGSRFIHLDMARDEKKSWSY